MADSSDSKKIVLADFGDWSKPVNTLIEKCADAVGGLFRPHQITRIAEAEAKAEEIRALAEIKVDRIQRRAATRFIAEETKKQINMEAIIRGALAQVNDTADPKLMNDDWVTNFFDKCRLISDEQMQAIWSRILAGEANVPGSFSKRTINLVAELDKSEVDLFTVICRYAFTAPHGYRYPIVLELQDSIYQQNGIGFSSLTDLANIGLVTMHSPSIVSAVLTPDAEASLQYFGNEIVLSFPQGLSRNIAVGCATFTNSGLELSNLSAAQPVPGLIEYVAQHWQRSGITVRVIESHPHSSGEGGGSKS